MPDIIVNSPIEGQVTLSNAINTIVVALDAGLDGLVVNYLDGLDPTHIAADDHTQYLTNTRGDIRYYSKAEVNALVQDIEVQLLPLIPDPIIAGSTYKIQDLGSVTGSRTINLTTASIYKMFLVGNVNLAFSNVAGGAANPTYDVFSGVTIIFTQDVVGKRTVTWPVNIKWANGIPMALSTIPLATDVISLGSYDGGFSWLVLAVVRGLR